MWAQQPKDIAAAPVPSQTLAVKKVFISSAGGEEVDPQTFGVPDMNPTRPYNQFYAALEDSGKYEAYAPVLKRKILDPRTGGSSLGLHGSRPDPGWATFQRKAGKRF
jgi:hypothetical protein